MPKERFFYPHPLQQDETISLEGKEHHHAAHVMRIAEGEEVEVIDGEGTLAVGKTIHVGKKKLDLQIANVKRHPKPLEEITLAQAHCRMSVLDLIIEKGVELGVTRFLLFPARASSRRTLSSEQKNRLSAIAVAAMKQCGALYLPELVFLSSMEELELGTNAFFGDTDPDAPKLPELGQTHHATFITGPEGGWKEEEVSLLREKGAQGVSLHRNTLRAETASIAAIALLSYNLEP